MPDTGGVKILDSDVCRLIEFGIKMAILLSGDYVRNWQAADVHHVVISALSASARFTTTMQSFVQMGEAICRGVLCI